MGKVDFIAAGNQVGKSGKLSDGIVNRQDNDHPHTQPMKLFENLNDISSTTLL